MNLTFQMTGIEALSLKAKFLRDAARAGMKTSVSEAAAMFQIEAKTLVPVKTGRLQTSIHTDTVEDTDQRFVAAVSPTFPASNEYGFEPPYARRIEFGFMGTDKLGRHYHQAAQPYMRPAFDSQQAAASKTIKDGIFEQMDAAMATVSSKRTG